MKKVISVLICFSLVFLCSCSLPQEIKETVNLNLDFLQDKTITSIDNNDSYIVIQATPFISEEEYFNEEKHNDEGYVTEYFYYLWDIERSRLKSELVQKSTDESIISNVFIDDSNQITLLSYDNPAESGIYDLSFNKVSDCYDTFQSRLDKYNAFMNNSESINSNRFSNYQNLATDTNYISKSLNVFLNDDSTLYFENQDDDYCVICCEDKLVLKNKVNYDNDEITYRLTDYSVCKSVEATVKYGKGSSANMASISDKYTVISVSDNTGKNNIITVWNNNYGESFDDNVEKIDFKNIDNAIKTAEDKITKEYNIDIESFKEYDENSQLNDYVYNNDSFCKSELLLALYDLDYCLSTFPKELYSEIIICDAEFDNFKIYLVGNFDDEINSSSVSAYCSNLNGELYIVYSLSAFTYSTFCHELMHAMEYRIWDYEPDFDEKWSSLNPEGFDYIHFDEEKNPYYDNEEYQKYFARDYSMNNELEDRATTFELVCDDAHLGTEGPWWAENKPFVKKAALLRSVIKNSYPSLSADNYSLWSCYENVFTM